MHDSKLLHIARSLSKKEMRAFVEYVQVPSVNKHKGVIGLVKLIQRHHPKFDHPNLDRTKVFAQLYPRQPFRDGKVRVVMSYTLDLLEEFLVQQHIARDPFIKKQFLLAELNHRQLTKGFEASLHQYRKFATEHPYRDEHFFYQSYLMENELDRFTVLQGRSKDNDNLQPKADNLDLFYLSAKLKTACEMINREQIVGIDYRMDMLEESVGFVNDHWDRFQHIPAVSIYHTVLKTLREPDQEVHFVSLKKRLQEQAKSFSPEEAEGMYAYAQNYCVRKINQGKSAYLLEIFELYQLLLADGLLLREGLLPEQHYKNIVSAGLRLKEYEWTKTFIEAYREQLAAQNQQNAYTYNLAAYYFETGNYAHTMALLMHVAFTDVFYNLGSKTMLLKSYYEEEEDEALFALLDSYRLYLRRNKQISDQQRKAHLSLLKFTKKLYKLKITGAHSGKASEKLVADLAARIKDSPHLANIEWLMEKLGELRG